MPKPVRTRTVLLAMAAAGVLGALLGLERLSPPDWSGGRTVDFEVLPGSGLGEVAQTLETAGVVRSRRAFRILAGLRGEASRLQAGAYRASTRDWAWEVLDRLVAGDTRDTTVTVPEGLWVREVAERLGPFVAGGVDSFLSAAGDSVFLASLELPGPGLEGYLFPSTYRIPPGVAPGRVIRLMVDTFHRVWGKHLAARADSLVVTVREAVTLASIVEAEAAVPEERHRIAAVYWNRLRRGLPLQADPTVVYALGQRRRRVLLDDLELASPYNTYRVVGLPPGPINNPGLASLRAALWPEPGCRDLYFVARGDGTHLFARTFAEHQANRRRVARERRSHSIEP